MKLFLCCALPSATERNCQQRQVLAIFKRQLISCSCLTLFFPRTVIDWNLLPAHEVNSLSVPQFRSQRDLIIKEFLLYSRTMYYCEAWFSLATQAQAQA